MWGFYTILCYLSLSLSRSPQFINTLNYNKVCFGTKWSKVYPHLIRLLLLLFFSFFKGTNQHDVQELNRILFSALEHSLVGTSGSTLIQRLYHGTIVNSIVCKECGNVSQRKVCYCAKKSLCWTSPMLTGILETPIYKRRWSWKLVCSFWV